jgi:hypothetical protein
MPVSITENATTVSERVSESEPHRARLGELERVRKQVLQHLLEALLVGRDLLGRVRRQLDREVDALLARHRSERAVHELLYGPKLRAAGVDVHLPGLDL